MDEPPPADPVRLQLSCNFMANTINAFCGALGNSSLLERLEAAYSLTDLCLSFDEWYQAISGGSCIAAICSLSSRIRACQ